MIHSNDSKRIVDLFPIGGFVCALLLSLTMSACGPATAVQVPSNFVSLDEDDLYNQMTNKSVSADGAIIVVRERDNEPEGNLDFWSDALSDEIENGRGYTLLGKEEVRSQAGYQGVVMQFASTYNGTAYRYNVALFVIDDLIVTVETTAPKAKFETHKEAFENAVRSLGPS